MKIHEYQAKEILARFGVSVPRSILADSPESAAAAMKSLGSSVAVVKAQVHAGGRGKGGGIQLVRSPEKAHEATHAMLSRPLVTLQTGPDGRKVRKVLVEEGCEIAKEYYVGIALDRNRSLPVLMASTEGGVEIEEVAHKTPEKILREPLDATGSLPAFRARRLAYRLSLPKEAISGAQKLFHALARVYTECDCSIVEINPLVLTKSNALLALDCKLVFDDNALFRHKDLVQLRDEHEEDPNELRASRSDLSYIALDGDIGCMVNGAGLAMATMDIIQLHGGRPANFLDVGGGATREKVTEAFKILLSDSKVKAVLVNIFGGIMKCDVIAEGILSAIRDVKLDVPLVVRLEGTNVEKGREILKNSGLAVIPASDMSDAAKKVVAASRGEGKR